MNTKQIELKCVELAGEKAAGCAESADAALELVEWMSKPENGGVLTKIRLISRPLTGSISKHSPRHLLSIL